MEHYFLGVFPSFPSEGKKILAFLINQDSKQCTAEVGHSEERASVGMDVSGARGLGTAGCHGTPVLFVARRSRIESHPRPLGFLTGRIGV